MKTDGVLSGGMWPRPRSGAAVRWSSASRDAAAAATMMAAAGLCGWEDVQLNAEVMSGEEGLDEERWACVSIRRGGALVDVILIR